MKGKRNENYVARIRRKGEIGLNNYFALAAVSVHSFLKQRGIKIVPLHVRFHVVLYNSGMRWEIVVD
jgi:hypothetical protein